MILSIDYDDTYTKDPLLWNWFIGTALERGHTVYCVSFRHETEMEEPRQTVGRLIGSANCFGTGGLGKQVFMDQKRIPVEVWIDDTPDSIVRGSEYYQLF